MKIVFQKIRALSTTMPIVYRKKVAFRPVFNVSFTLSRSIKIKNNWDSIFIVISLKTLMSVCRVGRDQSMRFSCKFGRLEINQRVYIAFTFTMKNQFWITTVLLSLKEVSFGFIWIIVLNHALLEIFIDLLNILNCLIGPYSSFTSSWNSLLTLTLLFTSLVVILIIILTCCCALWHMWINCGLIVLTV